MLLSARRQLRKYKHIRLSGSSSGSRPPKPPDDASSTSSTPSARPHMTASQLPSSSIGRIFHYGNLAASLAGGVAAEFVRRSGSSTQTQGGGLLLSESNVERLVDKLSQMRGAALKLGQFLSIQDAHVLPPEVERVFRRVQDRAHYMPNWQLEQVMREDLGADWAKYFSSFDRIPFASASIGQVHRATLVDSAREVAVKVQFPNVAQSIGADLAAIGLLLPAGRLLPRGLFLDRTLRILGQELAEECDYTREAAWARRFNAWLRDGLLGDGLPVRVPWIWESSTRRVLVMEFIEGVSVGGDRVQQLPQSEKDAIASAIMHLCLRELFEFRAMQTDPNWSNFLYSSSDGKRSLGLVDFGATREYSKSFIDDWLRLLRAAIDADEDGCYEMSKRLGYLTGEENEAMRSAHVSSVMHLGVPFRTPFGEPFSFARDGSWTGIAADIRAQIPVMVSNRLVPPPRETLSLNRKLSGAFLLAARLDAQVDCRRLWHEVTDSYVFGAEQSSSQPVQ